MSIDTYITSKIQKQSLIHSWRTSIQETIQGGEKRSTLLTWPRIKLNMELRFISSPERNFIRSSLFQNIHNLWGFPFVHDKTALTAEAASGQKVLTLGSTSYRHFYDGRGCILVDPDDWTSYGFGKIDTVDSTTQITMAVSLANTWPVKTLVYPIFEYRIDAAQEIDVEFRQLNYLSISASESFEAARTFTYSVPASGAPTYNGLDLFLTRPLYSLVEPYQHPYELLSFLGKGKAFNTYSQTRPGLSGTFRIVSRSDIWDLLNFFDSKRGRFQVFYEPSWDNDIVPTAAIDAADQTLTVEEVYLTSGEIVGRHLYIRFPDGTYVCREVSNHPVSTTLVIDSPIGTSVTAANLSKMLICFLYKVRFDIDEIEIDYTADEIAQSKLKFRVV